MDKDQKLKLAKILELADSKDEHEAVTALQDANQLLKQAGDSWHSILGLPNPATNFQVLLDKIDELLSVESTEAGLNFLNGCRDYLIRHEGLSERQEMCIVGMWDRFDYALRKNAAV